MGDVPKKTYPDRNGYLSPMGALDTIIVGGGLAGLTAALDLHSKGHAVLVIEKQAYPHHKVCGEYLSREVIPYLGGLDVHPSQVGAVSIDRLILSDVLGRQLQVSLPMGGLGISRYALDALLYQKAVERGITILREGVTGLDFQSHRGIVRTDEGKVYMARSIIGAYGKRSALDRDLGRDFMSKKSPWLAVKAHYGHYDFPDDQVGLHVFKGGYGGLSRTETGAINFCYLASYENFRTHGDLEKFNQEVVAENPILGRFLAQAKPLFDAPLTIGQVSFERKSAVENHVIMCGDSAGLIHPLCGNGMAMAIHSARLASEAISEFLHAGSTRIQMEETYRRRWRKAFFWRLWAGRKLQALLLNERWSRPLLSLAMRSPSLVPPMIRITHGRTQ